MDWTRKILDYPPVPQQFRSEGFLHQEYLALPGPIQETARRHPILRNLHATDAGFYPDAAGHRMERKRGASAAILIVCLAGRGWVELGAPARPVRPGQVILIAPGQAHAYGADLAEPWTIVWAHFRGEELEAWWRLLGLPQEGGIVHPRCQTPEELELGRVHEQLATGYDEPRQIAAASALRWSLSQLAGVGELPCKERDGIEEVATWMREHVSQRVTVKTLARRAGLSPAYFSLCFKKHTGFAPIDYFLRMKMRRACGMLHGTAWTVEQIARELGYEDAFYFSRLFRSIMGYSPKAYRDHIKG